MATMDRPRPGSQSGRPSQLHEHAVAAGDRQGRVADGERDEPGRIATHVARGEDARTGGLDRGGVANRPGPEVGSRASAPVRMKPLASAAMSGGSQSVRGREPGRPHPHPPATRRVRGARNIQMHIAPGERRAEDPLPVRATTGPYLTGRWRSGPAGARWLTGDGGCLRRRPPETPLGAPPLRPYT